MHLNLDLGILCWPDMQKPESCHCAVPDAAALPGAPCRVLPYNTCTLSKGFVLSLYPRTHTRINNLSIQLQVHGSVAESAESVGAEVTQAIKDRRESCARRDPETDQKHKVLKGYFNAVCAQNCSMSRSQPGLRVLISPGSCANMQPTLEGDRPDESNAIRLLHHLTPIRSRCTVSRSAGLTLGKWSADHALLRPLCYWSLEANPMITQMRSIVLSRVR